MSARDEHTGLQAIDVKTSTTTTINHWELGRQFFDWSNEEQASFLHGAHIGHCELGSWGHMQLHYIREAAQANGTLTELQEFVALLHEYFKEADK